MMYFVIVEGQDIACLRLKSNNFIAFKCDINSNLYTVPPVLLWIRTPSLAPFKPSRNFSTKVICISLLLLSGDIELNPGLQLLKGELTFGCINAHCARNEAALLHSEID